MGERDVPATAWRLRNHRHEPHAPTIPGWIQWLRRDQRLLKGAFYAAMIGIPEGVFE